MLTGISQSYAVGAEAGGGAVIDFQTSVEVRNISATVDPMLTEDSVFKDVRSGAESDHAEAYAFHAYDQGVIRLNALRNPQAVVQIENDMAVGKDGTIEGWFLNDASHFYGTVHQKGEGGTAVLHFKDATWRVTESNSQAVDLTLDGEAAVYLNQSADGATKNLSEDNTVTLTLSSLSGSGTFHLSTAVDTVLGDTLVIHHGEGSRRLLVTSTGENPSAEALDRALVTAAENTGGPLTFTLANENGVVDLGNYVDGLQSRKKDGADEGDGELEWFLAPKKDAGPDASSQTLSPSAAAALAFSGNGSQVSQYLHGLSDLRKRMGDVRRTASDGLYAGMRGGKDRIEGHAATTYRDQYRAVGLGLDRKVGEGWIVGGTFEALEGNQTTRSNGASASGRSTG